MTYLRFSSRHIHHTVADYVKAQMAALSWTTAGSVPFDAPVLKFTTATAMPSNRTDLVKTIEPGMVAITVGDEPDTIEEELGGELVTLELPIFFDIFMDSDATALAVANDIRDILKGRISGSKRHLPVVDQITSAEVAGWTIELTDVERARPDHNVLHWQIVKVTATTTFLETLYG
jgi:hypothetical protein